MDDFVAFARAQVASKDIDPAYPLLAYQFDREQLSLEIRIWRLLLYVACYNLGSAETLWHNYARPQRLPSVRVNTGVERRGFRGNDLLSFHVNDALRVAGGSLESWVASMETWGAARVRFQEVKFAGPWASYKWADLLLNVLGNDYVAEDIGVGGNSPTAGPVSAMVLLTGRDWRECAADRGLQRGLFAETVARGAPLRGLDQLETCLCDFNSLVKGHYYVGNDIDLMMDQLKTARPDFWTARDKVFEPRYLGERGGWWGVRKERLSVYARTGKILV